MGDGAIKVDFNSMKSLRATKNLWVCSWCETINENSAMSQGEQCIACRQLKSSRVWKQISTEQKSETIRNTYLSANFSNIADGIGNKLVAQTDSKYAKTALKIALAVELDLLDIYFCPSEDENGVRPTIGWRWPNVNYVSGVVLYQEKDGRRQRYRIPRLSTDNRKARNLGFEKSFDPTDTKLEVRLFFDDESRVESGPRFINYEVEG